MRRHINHGRIKKHQAHYNMLIFEHMLAINWDLRDTKAYNVIPRLMPKYAFLPHIRICSGKYIILHWNTLIHLKLPSAVWESKKFWVYTWKSNTRFLVLLNNNAYNLAFLNNIIIIKTTMDFSWIQRRRQGLPGRGSAVARTAPAEPAAVGRRRKGCGSVYTTHWRGAQGLHRLQWVPTSW